MPNQFLSPEGDLENYFVTEYWLIDQYIGDELWTWGSNSYGRLGNANITDRSTPVTTFSGGTNWKQVSSGYQHTVAVKTDGTLWVWGNGSYGRLGNANITDRSTPVTTFAGGTNWKQVGAGNKHTVAVKTDGTLWTWGYQNDGRLGNGVTGFSGASTPITTFAGGTDWRQVNSSGGSNTAAIKTDGTLWTWGYGGLGQLGNASLTSRSTPVTTFTGGTNWKQVSMGHNTTAAIKTDGTLWTWGAQPQGKLGNDFYSYRSTPVTTFAGGNNWDDVEKDLYTISAGLDHTAAIKTDGTLWIWGDAGTKLGTNNTTTNVSTPVTTFSGGINWKQISCGFSTLSHTAAIKTDGTLWIWGDNGSSQLGTNEGGDKRTPVTTFAGGTNWKQVSAGESHTAAIKTDGTLWTWGSGFSGGLGNGLTTDTRSTPVTTFAGGTNWKQVSAGDNHTAAIKTDGTLWTWGIGTDGKLGIRTLSDKSTPVTTFAGGTNWKQVSSGNRHTTAIKTDGTLWTWGNGISGQLGNASTTNVSTPVTTFAGGTDWKQVSVTGGFTAAHIAAIKTDGTLWTWGGGSSGRLGNASTTNVSTPITTFSGGTNWKQVSSGGYHTIALRDDGVNKELYVFGTNSSGQLGNASTVSVSTPVTTFAGGTNWEDVEKDLYTISASAGTNSSIFGFTAAIKTDGTLWTWGRNRSGSLGNTNSSNDTSTPVTTFAGGTNWKQVSNGSDHTSAIKTDGTLWIWGTGSVGRLGNAGTTSKSTPVTTFAGGTDWKQVDTGDGYTAAIKTDGTLWIWGNGSNGRLGNAATTNVSTPVTTFVGGTDWKQVSAGYRHTAAVKTDGTLWTWGNGGSVRLGTNDTITRSTPVTTFAGGTDWKQVSAGDAHTSAIKTDGTLWTWGNGFDGQLGNAATTNRSTPVTTRTGGTNWKQVSAGDLHTAAIKTDGTLWTWGNNVDGRLGNANTTKRSTPVTTFTGGTNWKQVSAGGYHTVALRDDGVNKELYVWGESSSGKLGDSFADRTATPITTFAGGTNWKQVSASGGGTGASGGHTAAVKTDGTLWTWGDTSSGELGINSFIDRFTPVTTFAGGTNWKQVDTGDAYTVAVKTDGTLWVWGLGNYGRLGNGVTTGDILTPITTFAGGTNWKQVSAGDGHTAAVQSGISPEYPLS